MILNIILIIVIALLIIRSKYNKADLKDRLKFNIVESSNKKNRSTDIKEKHFYEGLETGYIKVLKHLNGSEEL